MGEFPRISLGEEHAAQTPPAEGAGLPGVIATGAGTSQYTDLKDDDVEQVEEQPDEPYLVDDESPNSIDGKREEGGDEDELEGILLITIQRLHKGDVATQNRYTVHPRWMGGETPLTQRDEECAIVRSNEGPRKYTEGREE